MKSRNEILAELSHCTGSEQIFFTPLFKNIRYTEGVKLMSEICGAHWLLTDILAVTTMLAGTYPFISIKVKKEEDSTKCTVYYEDGNDNIIKEDYYGFTDFPLYDHEANGYHNCALNLYCIDNILLLTSEY